jgi:hypothetical protein
VAGEFGKAGALVGALLDQIRDRRSQTSRIFKQVEPERSAEGEQTGGEKKTE